MNGQYSQPESSNNKRFFKPIAIVAAIAAVLIAGILLTIILLNSKNEPTITGGQQASDVPVVGGIIEFGGYDWRVLEIKDGKALILSDLVLESRAYHGISENISWESSGIRSYLNSEFYNSFNGSDRARIVETEVVNKSNPVSGTLGGNDTVDKIFLLSMDEVNEHFSDNNSRVAYNRQGQASLWWLRSPGYGNSLAAIVLSDGIIDFYGLSVTYDNGGVRPALWLNPEPYDPVVDDANEPAVGDDLQTAEDPVVKEDQQDLQDSVDVVEIIEFGGYDWRVLDMQDGKALILSELVLESRAYQVIPGGMQWGSSDIRDYLNGEFYNSFNEADRARIIETTVVNNDNPKYEIWGGADTEDKIFLLSIDEVNEYFNDDNSRIAKNERGSPMLWWLRSPGLDFHLAALVFFDGNVRLNGERLHVGYVGVRPALWLKLES